MTHYLLSRNKEAMRRMSAVRELMREIANSVSTDASKGFWKIESQMNAQLFYAIITVLDHRNMMDACPVIVIDSRCGDDSEKPRENENTRLPRHLLWLL